MAGHEEDAGIALVKLIGGYKVTQAISVAAKLNVADAIGDGTLAVDAVAQNVGADRELLYRLLRFLASHGVFAEGPIGQFTNSPMSDALRTGGGKEGKPSLRPYAMMEPDNFYMPCSHLLEVVQGSSKSGAQLAYGKEIFAHIKSDPGRTQVFSDAMSAFSTVVRIGFERYFPPCIAGKDDALIVDLGGGNGHVVAKILKTRPAATGVVVELPHVQPAFDKYVASGDCPPSFKAGSFFEAGNIPKGAALYLIAFCIHNWNDESCKRILSGVRDAMDSNSYLVVMEMEVEKLNEFGPSKNLDLVMICGLSGKERTREEYSALFNSANIKLADVVATAKPVSLIIGQRDESN